jgi:hypothetical protein
MCHRRRQYPSALQSAHSVPNTGVRDTSSRATLCMHKRTMARGKRSTHAHAGPDPAPSGFFALKRPAIPGMGNRWESSADESPGWMESRSPVAWDDAGVASHTLTGQERTASRIPGSPGTPGIRQAGCACGHRPRCVSNARNALQQASGQQGRRLWRRANDMRHLAWLSRQPCQLGGLSAWR